jgi:hypothetical protein
MRGQPPFTACRAMEVSHWSLAVWHAREGSSHRAESFHALRTPNPGLNGAENSVDQLSAGAYNADTVSRGANQRCPHWFQSFTPHGMEWPGAGADPWLRRDERHGTHRTRPRTMLMPARTGKGTVRTFSCPDECAGQFNHAVSTPTSVLTARQRYLKSDHGQGSTLSILFPCAVRKFKTTKDLIPIAIRVVLGN